MGNKLKITEAQLKMLVENKNKIQEQNEGDMGEERIHPSKEEYFARHGRDGDDSFNPWTGGSNITYRDLPDGDYDDETYDDFDTLHAAHPDFHKHYAGNTHDPDKVDRAKSLFYLHKNSRGPLHIKRRRSMDDFDPHYDRDQEINYGVDDDDMINESIEKIKANFKRFL